MKKERIKIPDDLAAEIMFNSDKTCCVCRNPDRKVQIHHIDSNPVNNKVSNLAVLCNDCHSEAHTNHAFTRNLTPELIKKYNESWKATVKARLEVGGIEGEELEYRQQVLLEISLIPHQWKIEYMALYPGHFQNTEYNSEIEGGDVWDAMTKCGVHTYSLEEWEKYKVLFDNVIRYVIDRLERILMIYGDAVPSYVKLAILRSNSQLQLTRTVYLTMPNIFEIKPENSSYFTMRFAEVIQILSKLSRLADKERQNG